MTNAAGFWAVEVKTGEYASRELSGLMEFGRRNPDYRPLVLCYEEHCSMAAGLGMDAIPWPEFVWNGPKALAATG